MDEKKWPLNGNGWAMAIAHQWIHQNIAMKNCPEIIAAEVHQNIAVKAVQSLDSFDSNILVNFGSDLRAVFHRNILIFFLIRSNSNILVSFGSNLLWQLWQQYRVRQKFTWFDNNFPVWKLVIWRGNKVFGVAIIYP
jgi:hypothetical protein